MNPVSSDETPTPHTDGLNAQTDLAPCPFCGAFPSFEEYTYTGDVTYRRIYCENNACFINPETSRSERGKSEILTWWNTRAARPVSSSSSQPQVTREKEEAGGASTESTDTRGSKEEG